MERSSAFTRYAMGVLGYTVLVILWGAWVRISYSGAGCGEDWPLCHGTVLPDLSSGHTVVELSHRLTSGVLVLLVIAMLVWAVRAFPKGHLVRRGAWLSLVLLITESLLGAGLVIFGLVEDDASVSRAIAMAIHFLNTSLLSGAILLTAYWSHGEDGWQTRLGAAVPALLSVVALLLIGVSGTIMALGDTVPEAALAAVGAEGHYLVQLRAVHPLTALLLASFLGAGAVFSIRRGGPRMKAPGASLLAFLCASLILGVLDAALQAPAWAQVIHLVAAIGAWLSTAWLAASLRYRPLAGADAVAPRKAA